MSIIRSRFSFVITVWILSGLVFPFSGDAMEPPPPKNPETKPMGDQPVSHAIGPFFRRGLFPRSPDTEGKHWQLESRQPRSWISSISWHPDGQLLAVGESAGCVRIYNPETWELVTLRYCEGPVGAVSYSPDGKWLAARIAKRRNAGSMPMTTGDRENSIPIIKIWKADGTTSAEMTAAGGNVANLAWSPDSQRIAAVSNYRTVCVIDLKGQPKQILEGHRDTIGTIAWNPQGDKIASASRDGAMRVWHLSRAKRERDRVKDSPGRKFLVPSTTFKSDKAITGLRWMPDGKTLACAESSGRVFLQHLDGQTEEISGQQPGSRLVAPHRDGKRLAISGRKSLTLFDISKKSSRVLKPLKSVRCVTWHPQRDRVAVINGHGVHILDLENDREKILVGRDSSSSFPRPIVWSPDGKVFTCASLDSWLQFWKADGSGVARQWKVPGTGIAAVSWSSNNRWLATLGLGEKLRLWTIEGKKGPSFGDWRTGGYRIPVWSPDGKILAIVGIDGTFRFVNDEGKLLSAYGQEKSQRHIAQWSPRSNLLAIAGTGDVARIKLLATDGTIVKTMEGEVRRIRGLAWHPQAQRLAMIDLQGNVRDWNADGTRGPITGQHENAGASLAWSPNGRWLASSSTEIKIWNADGSLQTTIDQSANTLLDKLAWHPQSTWIAAQIHDRMVRLWKPTGEKGPTLYGTALAGGSMAWNSQGDRIACSTENNSIIVWDAATGSTRWVGLELPDGKSAVIDSQGNLFADDVAAFDQRFVFVKRIDGKNVLKTAAQWPSNDIFPK